jgi:hypothetical protein
LGVPHAHRDVEEFSAIAIDFESPGFFQLGWRKRCKASQD